MTRLRIRVYPSLISRASLNRRSCSFYNHEVWQFALMPEQSTRMGFVQSLFILFSCYILSIGAVVITSFFPSLTHGPRDGSLVSSPSNMTIQDSTHPLNSSKPSENASAILNLTAIPPLRYDFRDGDYIVSMYRRPATSATPSAENPGVTWHNWNQAVNSAYQQVTAQREAAGATALDTMPTREYQYMTYLDRPALRDRSRQRTLVFTVTAKEVVPQLRYIEVDVVLLALLDYGQKWRTPPPGRARDMVRMCRFDLHWEPAGLSPGLWIASGTAVLVIPAANVQ